MKTLFNWVDAHPIWAGIIAFYVFMYLLFLYYSIAKVSEIVENFDEDWREGKEDNF